MELAPHASLAKVQFEKKQMDWATIAGSLIIANSVCLALSGFILAMTLLPPRNGRKLRRAT